MEISETMRDMREILLPLQEIGITKQEYDVRFCARTKNPESAFQWDADCG